MKYVAIIMLVSLWVVVTHAETTQKGSKLDTEFTLKMGQKTSIKDAKLTVKFIAVVEDARCPEGSMCVWVGNAKIKLKIKKGALRSSKVMELNTLNEPKELNINGVGIKITKLNPLPKPGQKTDQKSYELTLIASKKPAPVSKPATDQTTTGESSTGQKR